MFTHIRIATHPNSGLQLQSNGSYREKLGYCHRREELPYIEDNNQSEYDLLCDAKVDWVPLYKKDRRRGE